MADVGVTGWDLVCESERELGMLLDLEFGGCRLVVAARDDSGIATIDDRLYFGIPIPTCDPFVAPILYAIPIQLLAYHIAVLKGTDVDQPRNLAKSVTVE